MSGGLQISRGGNGPTGMTSLTATIPNVSTAVNLTAPSNVFCLVNYSSTVSIYVSCISPATSSNFTVKPGASYSYDGVPVSTFYILGSTTTSDLYGVYGH